MMVNILAAVTGGILDYGATSMECDRVLKDWVDASPLRVPASQGEGAKWGKFLMIGSNHKQLAKDITVLKNADGNFEEFVKVLSPSNQKEWSHTTWLESSGHMTELSKLLNQAENQKLLGLTLSTTFGRPLRYCIQYEVAPAAGYWSYYANHLNSTNQVANKTTLVIVGSCNPLLAISRAISPLASSGLNIILIPENDLFAIPCLLMGEIFNKAGLHCSVYAGSQERLKEITALEDVNVIVCGSYEQAFNLRNETANLELDVDGKKAIVVMETADCDAAVDAALIALKTTCYTGPGLYLIVQDCVMEDVDWRLRERFGASRSGDLLDKMVDFANDSRFGAPQKVIDYLGGTGLDVLKLGNARIVFDAQPSMPLTQWSQLGQSLLVFSYRSMGELLNLVGNLTGLSEISLWTENQSVALHVTNQIQVPRIWVNGFASYEPGFDHLLPINHGKLKTVISDGKVNTALYAVLDGLRTTQRSWSNVGNRNVLITKFLKQLLAQEAFSAKTGLLLELITTISRDTGKVATSTAKRGMIFDLADPVGVVAVIAATDSDRLDSLIRFISLALWKGNAIILSTNTELNSIAQILVKIAKEAGLPNVLVTCPNIDENHRALLKHHGIRMLVACGPTSLPALAESHIKRVLDLNSSSDDHLVERKWAWVATGEGLAN